MGSHQAVPEADCIWEQVYAAPDHVSDSSCDDLAGNIVQVVWHAGAQRGTPLRFERPAWLEKVRRVQRSAESAQ
jgi:hypothetical protein